MADKMSSLESELPALHWGGRPHIISYREPWKTRFDLVMAGLIVYVAVTLPVRIGFQLDASDGVFIFECILEVLFLLDLLFNFFTTFDDTNTKEEVRDHRRIVRRYLRGDFVLDCLSSFPFNLLSLMLPLSAGSSWFKILRVLRLGRVSAIRKFMEGMEKRTENPVLFRIVGIILVFLLVVHMVACLFWLTASSQGFINLGLDEFGLLDRGRSWVPTLDVLDGGFWAQYSKSVAFALANLSGSAMGSETVKEYWFESAAFLLGFLINATIIASASSLLSNIDIQAMEKKNHLDRINNYMRSTNVNQGLQAKIRGYYHFLWDIGMSNYSQTILRELPPKLHLQLNLTLKKPLVEKCPLFKTCSPAAVIAIVQNLHALIILPNDLVVKAGEKADCMFFINRGSVSIFIPSVDPDGKDCVEYLVTLKKGAFFGEVGILDPSSKRTANVLSEQYCELQVLKARDCQVLLDSFPEFSEAIQYLAQKRRRAAVSKRGASFSRRLGAAGVPYRPGENPSRRRSSISSMIKSPAAQTRRWSQSKKFSQDQQSFSKEFGSRSLTQQESTDKSRSTKKSLRHQQSSLASGADDNEVVSKRQSLESMAKEEDSVSFFSSSHGTASSKRKSPQKEPLGAKKGEKYATVVNNIDCNAGDAESAEKSSKNAEQSAVQAALPSPSFAKASTIKLKRVATTIKLVNRMGGGNQGAASQKKEEQNFYEEVLNAENNISYGMARDFSAGVGIAEAKLEEAVAEKDLIMHTPHPSDLDTEAD